MTNTHTLPITVTDSVTGHVFTLVFSNATCRWTWRSEDNKRVSLHYVVCSDAMRWAKRFA